MGIFFNRNLILLLGILVCSTTGLVHADTGSVPTEKSVPLLFTRNVNASSAKESPARKAKDPIMPLEITVNGAKAGTWLLLERDGAMYAPRDAFEEWRVELPPSTKPIDFKLNDQTYWPLSAVPGYKFKLDFANQSAELTFSPEVFAATQLAQDKSNRPVPSPVLPSLFLNYDLNYQTTILPNAPTIKDLGMLSEIGASNSWGVLTSSQGGRNLNNDPNSSSPHNMVRLETTFTRNYAESNRTLRLGDTVTRAGMWGRNVYFGGIQFGSNFALTPGFVSQPIPVVSGMSTAPSTVEMYVNDVLRQVSTVPTGPFAIDNSTPVLTGNGDVKLVVRDILGRETVIEQSFFTSPQLLAKGLDDWSVEAGSVRKDMGVSSNHYSSGFTSGTWRHGYSNDLTLEGRAELTSSLRAAGVGIVAALPRAILGKASLAFSQEQGLGGGFWLLGLEHQRLHSSLSFQIQGASQNFRQLGQNSTITPIKMQAAGNWTYSTERAGSFGIGLAVLNQFEAADISTITGNYSKRIGKNSSLSLTASKAINGGSGTSIGLYFVKPLDNNRIVSTTANSRDGKNDFYVTAMQNPVHEHELGWRTMAGYLQNNPTAEGGVYYTGRYGKLTGDASKSTDWTSLRLGAIGGMVMADKHFFVTQKVDQSFAVAEVGDYQDIGVGLGSNVLTHTNSSGAALIPRLIPYQNNAIRLDPNDLPISAEIDSIEQNAVPAWRSAVKVVFPVRGGRGALLKIILENGEDVPAGATVNIEGDKQEFYVARRGAAFITGLKDTDSVLLHWNGQQCKINVTLPPEIPDEIARVGPYTCKGVTR